MNTNSKTTVDWQVETIRAYFENEDARFILERKA